MQQEMKPKWVAKLNDLFPFDWELLKHAGAEPVPYHLKKWWFCLGGTVLYLFIIQVVTGIMLTFYYIPNPEFAYESVSRITHEIRFGWFLRSIHRWSANLMIIAVFLHMFRVFFTGAYRHPRQLNWVFGFVLFIITLVFGFTGYSLVYEQLSFWGATVAANLTNAVPLLGPTIAYLMRGGPEVGSSTLTRFYIFHIGVLPTLAFIFIGLHILMIRLQGVTELKFEGEIVADKDRHFPFWPDHVTTELMIGVFIMYILTLLALIFPAHLGDKANPNLTPEHIKPEWYFYASFKLLKLTSLKISVLTTSAIIGIAMFWPFIESWLQKRIKLNDKLVVLIGVLTFLGFLTLTIWESFS